jgi:hypothetical protein
LYCLHSPTIAVEVSSQSDTVPVKAGEFSGALDLKPAIDAFKSNAVCSVSSILFKSLVLFTFPNPTITEVTPYVPVKAGEFMALSNLNLQLKL